MKRYIKSGILALTILFSLESCKKFLDVVPDNVATLENAFGRRIEAQKYLFTCYSYLPKNGDLSADPAVLGGDELWHFTTYGGFLNMARGFQNSNSPLGDRWSEYYLAIRDCNIFLENIDRVPNLNETERLRWTAEVKFLKAYYHFLLMKMYGPIPLMKENIPIEVSEVNTNVSRATVDEGFGYIVQLLDEAKEHLPLVIDNPASETGRITRVIDLSLKAKVLVYAASPLFNGNTDGASLKNRDGSPLFSASFSKEKWVLAAAACKEAIDISAEAGFELYKFHPSFGQKIQTDTIITQMSIRNAVVEKWNSEIIWGNTQTNSSGMQRLMTTFWDKSRVDNAIILGHLSPTLKIAEMFYTANGVPIDEDNTYNYNERYGLKTAEATDNLYIREGYQTASLNFNREPRFYADLGFDGGVWYGQGQYDDQKPNDLFYLEAKYGQRNGFGKTNRGSVTGYYLKKLIHFQNVIGNANEYSINYYPFTLMRLGDLYLMYAEALNEAEGPVADVHKYIDLVRKRAGLKSVKYSWDTFTNNPKYTTQTGMRDIIHRERLIELAFEGPRFWDLRRWKESANKLNGAVKGWDLVQKDADLYYRPRVLYNQTFGVKDYFWPIRESYLSRNRNLVQNVGW